MALNFQLELGAVRSFKRLSYTAWHALAEFVDNSTQSYHSNVARLDEAFAASSDRLTVEINYNAAHRRLEIRDNAMGMSRAELRRAMKVGKPPVDPWRSR